jgi:hypothetical protein
MSSLQRVEGRGMTAREQCKRQRGDEPCIKTYAADYKTVTSTYECVDWCPVLNKLTEAEMPVTEGRIAA